MRTLTFRKGQENPKVQVTIGNANIGTYSVMLGSDESDDWKVIKPSDPITGTFDLGPVDELNNMVLRWDLIITVPTVPGPFGAIVSVTQGGTEIGKFKYPNPYPGQMGTNDPNPYITLDLSRVVVQ
jgi:hypothetical protein